MDHHDMKNQGTAMHQLKCIGEKLDDVISLLDKQHKEIHHMSKELDLLKAQADLTIALESEAIAMLQSGSTNGDTAALSPITDALKASYDKLKTEIGNDRLPPVFSNPGNVQFPSQVVQTVNGPQGIQGSVPQGSVPQGLNPSAPYTTRDAAGNQVPYATGTTNPTGTFGQFPGVTPADSANRTAARNAAVAKGSASFTWTSVQGVTKTEQV